MFVVQWGTDIIILYNRSFDICGENKTYKERAPCARVRTRFLQAGWSMFMKGERVKTVQAVFYGSLSEISNTTVCETTWW